MTNYRRIFMPVATWFFTVNLAPRDNQAMLVEHIEELRQAFRYVQQRRVFQIDAIVILPDHLHSIWTLPDGDSDYSTRWNLIKGHFSRHMVKDEAVSASRSNKRERGIWQRRL
jgi:putative transposase